MFPKHHRFILGVLALGLLLAGGFVYFDQQRRQQEEITSFDECVEAGNPVMESYPPQCRTKDGKHFTKDIGNELEMIDIIFIEHPRPNQEITSPLLIKGRARGTYFFEATFPIRLVDSQGTELAESYVETQGEWMTEEFVPFTGELEFQTEDTHGTLYLEKANPSGLSENEQTLVVPVVFTTE